jgi:hypothetical protein
MTPIHFTVALAILGFVPPQPFGQAASDGPVNTTLCNLMRTPELFDGKKVQVRGVVRGGFETVTISDESCAAYVWLSWDTGNHEIEEEYEIAYIGSQSELAFPEKLDWKPFQDRSRVNPIQNDARRRLDYYLGQYYGPKGFRGRCHDRPISCPAFSVKATLTGRFDHRELRLCAVRVRSQPGEIHLSKGGCGFGHLLSFDSQLAVEVVSEVVASRIDPAAYRKKR